VLEDAADRARFWKASTPADLSGVPDSWLAGMTRAPLIIVPHSNKDAYLDRYAAPDKGWTDRDEARWPVPYWHIDAGFASLLMLLGAVDAGLGACFFGIPPQTMATYRDAFGVPEEYVPIGAITVGYPAPYRRSPSLRRGRRGVDEVVHRGRWASFR
jgi:nitroreductase